MRTGVAAIALSVVLLLPVSGAPPKSVYVDHDKVNAALARSATLISLPNVKVAGVHRDTPGPLETQKDAVMLYVVSGDATFLAGAQSQHVMPGDVVVVPAGVPQSFSAVQKPVSAYLVAVPSLLVAGLAAPPAAGAAITFVDHEKVAATLHKAGPIAEMPNAHVSGGYRTGPYAPADYRPDAEVHESEADLFYIVDGDATLVTGGVVVDGRQTGPGQIRGSHVEGGRINHLTKGDVMWVPAGEPHWFPQIPKPLSYLLVKVVSPQPSRP